MLDLYHLTMAYGYWKEGLHGRPAVFHHFFRKAPFGNPYVLAGGLHLLIDLVEAFRFSVEDIQYLGGLKGSQGNPLFDEPFLNYLQRMEFSCDIDAVPEGKPVFPHQPMVRVTGPLLQAQIIESAILNLVNFSSLIATKASRMRRAAPNDSILEFGLRRAQGLDGALTASRAAFIGGCDATSNVMAGRYYGIPVKGTHAHSWVMCFSDEREAFRAYAEAMPGNCILLVDTYDTLNGVRNAIAIAREMRARGQEMNGIRLDSGDLAELSIRARAMLDEAGFPDVAIVASDSIDEYRLQQMKEKGAQVSIWGIGTRLVTAYDQPALGGVYKLAALQDEGGRWVDRIKLSEEAIKTSNPGRQQIRRFFDAEGRPQGDMIYDPFDKGSDEMITYPDERSVSFRGAQGEELLLPIFRSGQLVYKVPELGQIREDSLRNQEIFRNISADSYPLGLEKDLFQRKQKLIESSMVDA